MHRCRRCGLYLIDNLEEVRKHREPGGECDQIQDDLQDELDEEGGT